MVSSVTVGAALLLASLANVICELHPLSDEFISLINSKQNSWRAGRNFAADTSMAYMKGLMGVLKDDHPLTFPVKVHDPELIASLPDNFDPRVKWPHCPTLNEIRDQGSCGSCWAFGAVEAMTDRVCIFSNGTKNVRFSAQDLVSCCDNCGHGCTGGSPYSAWHYWKQVGLVSGGQYNSSQGCRPYEIAPCSHVRPVGNNSLPYCHKAEPTPECIRKCGSNYNVEYNNDKHHGKSNYTVHGEDNIKAELFKNGPVEAVLLVFQDFLQYKSGVYSRTTGFFVGLHAVKMMGWGVEDGRKYWLVANSWNSGWGDKGYFKILRGSNECFIETSIVAGEPALD